MEVEGYRINLDHVAYTKPSGPFLNVYFSTGAPFLSLQPESVAKFLTAIDEGQAAADRDAAPRPATPRPTLDTDGARSGVLLRDDFDGKLALDWQVIRPDPTHASLTRNPGALTITTQRGSIHARQADDRQSDGLLARNIHLVSNPLAPDADFCVTTCIAGVVPDMPYQQAGLIVYGDDDNYLKWDYEYDWGRGEGQNFVCVVEQEGVPSHHRPDNPEAGLGRYWLRLTRRGDRFEYASSLDGLTYRTHGTVAWVGAVPRRLGLIAKNGGAPGANEIDARFESFEVRSLTPTPATADRSLDHAPGE